MTQSRVRDMAEDMMVGRFQWKRTGPIEVAGGQNGVRIILDGHHRTAAAIVAELESVPILVKQVPTQTWSQLMQEVLEAAGVR